MTEELIAKNLLDERLRNRCIDTIELLALGDDAVCQFGAAEYFNWSFDWFPDSCPLAPPASMSDEEASAAEKVLKILREASTATPRALTNETLIESGWPRRIQSVAEEALKIFTHRSRGVED